MANVRAEETNMRFRNHNSLETQKAATVRVRIHYLGLVKTYTNKTEEDFNLDEGVPLSSLLEQLASQFGKPFNPEVYDPSKREVKPMFMILVNGIVIGQLAGIDTKLNDGDMIMLMPLMTGG